MILTNDRARKDSSFDKIDRTITLWMARHSGHRVLLVRHVSPAEERVRNTIYFVDADIFLRSSAYGNQLSASV